MSRPNRNPTIVLIVVFLLIGTTAVMVAFWLIDHRSAIPNSGVVLAVSVGIFLVTFAGAFLLYLRWRGGKRAVITQPAPPTLIPRKELDGTIYGLIPGSQYQVMKSFIDFYGKSFEQGEILRFRERYFLPYDGGHTVAFEERLLYLQEERNQDILDNFSEYIALINQGSI